MSCGQAGTGSRRAASKDHEHGLGPVRRWCAARGGDRWLAGVLGCGTRCPGRRCQRRVARRGHYLRVSRLGARPRGADKRWRMHRNPGEPGRGHGNPPGRAAGARGAGSRCAGVPRRSPPGAPGACPQLPGCLRPRLSLTHRRLSLTHPAGQLCYASLTITPSQTALVPPRPGSIIGRCRRPSRAGTTVSRSPLRFRRDRPAPAAGAAGGASRGEPGIAAQRRRAGKECAPGECGDSAGSGGGGGRIGGAAVRGRGRGRAAGRPAGAGSGRSRQLPSSGGPGRGVARHARGRGVARSPGQARGT